MKFHLSTWSSTVHIVTSLADGALIEYFSKSASLDAGRIIVEGELRAMTELYQVIPSSIPKPFAHGKFVTEEPPIYFLLSEYVDMRKDDSDPEILCAKIVELHRKSVSPTGKFGFKVWTCNGRTPQAVEWDDSWTSLFRKMMIHVLAEDIKANGRWPEYERVGKTMFSDVIPRLIGALERDVRSMEPCLVQ